MLKRILTGLVVLVVIAVGVSFLLPRNVHVERSIAISAPAEKIFPLINSLRQFNEWSPWMQLDPNVTITYSGPETGVGAKMAWQSENRNVGAGTSEIIESLDNQRTVQALDFGDMGNGTAYFDITPGESGASRVTWGFDTDLGMNPIGRYMGLMFDSWLGKDYEAGLSNLKKLAEAGTE